MPKRISPKRKYDSSRRKARALESQAQIVEAARKLFIAGGYSGTTIAAIAREAGVAPETIYSVFGNKRAILSRAMDALIEPDGDPVPSLVRSYIKEVESERNQSRQIQLFAKRIRLIMEHSAPTIEVMRSAAKTEPEATRLLKRYLDNRLQGMSYFIDCVMANGPLRDEMDKLKAVETIWALTSAEIYNLLTVDRGWPAEEYEAWLAEVLTRLLLP